MTPLNVRKATAADVPALMGLIKELAEYEREPNAVINTPQQLTEDGFGDNPVFTAYVAEHEGQIVGMALYYIAYSTWKGKIFFIDDIVVTERFRHKGVGTQLLLAVFRDAINAGVQQIRWQVLDWNTPAISFYKKVGAEFAPEWITCRMDKNSICAFVEKFNH
ncbi:MAG: GNAT family N-acetyltransferase [Chitinophagales bacterium]|nr:GNAT family N-acetyltransferase [Chitinophagales bacterium]